MPEFDELRTNSPTPARVASSGARRSWPARRSPGERELEARRRADREHGRPRRSSAAGERTRAVRHARRSRSPDRDRRRGADWRSAFTPFTDPSEAAAPARRRLPDPAFPLRLETRFKPGGRGSRSSGCASTRTACLVDSFEPSLPSRRSRTRRVLGRDLARRRRRSARARRLARAGRGARVGPGRLDRRASTSRSTRRTSRRGPRRRRPADRRGTGPLPAAVGDLLGGGVAAAATRPPAGAYAALEGESGAAQARQIVDDYRPVQLRRPPEPAPARAADAAVKVAVLQVTPPTTWRPAGRRGRARPGSSCCPSVSCSSATPRGGGPVIEIGARSPPRSRPAPTRTRPASEQLKPDGDDLAHPAIELAWMFDFERAVADGHGLPGRPDRRSRPRRLRAARRPRRAPRRHARARAARGSSGCSSTISTAGRPRAGAAGHAHEQHREGRLRLFVPRRPRRDVRDLLPRAAGSTTSPRRSAAAPRRQWLADLLGLRHELVQRIPNAGARDQTEARAMQIALWPGTLGYMMRTMLAPVFDESRSPRPGTSSPGT